LPKTNDANRSSNTWTRMIRLIVGRAINVRRRTYGCTRDPQPLGLNSEPAGNIIA
jgi:hypothetical protein